MSSCTVAPLNSKNGRACESSDAAEAVCQLFPDVRVFMRKKLFIPCGSPISDKEMHPVHLTAIVRNVTRDAPHLPLAGDTVLPRRGGTSPDIR